ASLSQTPVTPAIGSAVSYQLVVTNTGSATIQGVTVADTIAPIIVGATAMEDASFATPVVTQLAGTGSLFVWSQPVSRITLVGTNTASSGGAATLALTTP